MPTDKPKFRDDLKIIRQVTAGEVGYVVKDPFNKNYYRFQEYEYQVLMMCDGQTDAAKLVAKVNKANAGEDKLTEAELKQFLAATDKMGIFEKTGAEMNAMILARLKETRKSRLTAKKGSILYKRIPAVDPQKYFNKIYPYIKFFWTPGFIVISLAMMAIAGMIVAANWDEVADGVRKIMTFQQDTAGAYFQLWAIVMVVIALHEHAHGLTCHHFGGEVHEMGFLVMFFQPCMYANVSDAWTFADRGKRLWVTAAGAYFEFWIGSIATMLWAISDHSTAFGAFTYQAMTVCGISTVLVNFNPLMKYDGYYILCDLLETANLKTQSAAYMKLQFKKYLFRLDVSAEEEVFLPREKRAFLVYGILSTVYMTGLMIGLWSLASGFLIENLLWLGVAIALLLGYKLFGRQITKFLGFLKEYLVSGPILKTRRRRIAVASVALALVAAMFIPVIHRVDGNCELQALGAVTVRPQVGGFVQTILKKQGDRVGAGDPIAVLRDDKLTTSYEAATLSYESLQIQAGRLTEAANTNQRRQLLLDLARSKSELESKQRDIANLTVRAPIAGVITTPDMETRVGDYIGKGKDLCDILEPSAMRVSVQIEQRDYKDVHADDPVIITLNSFPDEKFVSHVARVAPISGKRPNRDDPYYRAESEVENPPLEGDPMGKLRVGMSGTAGIEVGSRFLGAHLWAKIRKSLKSDLLS